MPADAPAKLRPVQAAVNAAARACEKILLPAGKPPPRLTWIKASAFASAIGRSRPYLANVLQYHIATIQLWMGVKPPKDQGLCADSLGEQGKLCRLRAESSNYKNRSSGRITRPQQWTQGKP